MTCSSCGSALAVGLRFCNRCGAKLSTEREVSNRKHALPFYAMETIVGVALVSLLIMVRFGQNSATHATGNKTVFIFAILSVSVSATIILPLIRHLSRGNTSHVSLGGGSNPKGNIPVSEQAPISIDSTHEWMPSITEYTTRKLDSTSSERDT
jgi:hypothetical protein